MIQNIVEVEQVGAGVLVRQRDREDGAPTRSRRQNRVVDRQRIAHALALRRQIERLQGRNRVRSEGHRTVAIARGGTAVNRRIGVVGAEIDVQVAGNRGGVPIGVERRIGLDIDVAQLDVADAVGEIAIGDRQVILVDPRVVGSADHRAVVVDPDPERGRSGVAIRIRRREVEEQVDVVFRIRRRMIQNIVEIEQVGAGSVVGQADRKHGALIGAAKVRGRRQYGAVGVERIADRITARGQRRGRGNTARHIRNRRGQVREGHRPVAQGSGHGVLVRAVGAAIVGVIGAPGNVQIAGNGRGVAIRIQRRIGLDIDVAGLAVANAVGEIAIGDRQIVFVDPRVGNRADRGPAGIVIDGD